MDAQATDRIPHKQPNAVRTAVRRGLKALRLLLGNGADDDFMVRRPDPG
jgi:hypothetical protein